MNCQPPKISITFKPHTGVWKAVCGCVIELTGGNYNDYVVLGNFENLDSTL
jgi:hypothetical protein